jgi:DNA-directed RNA polymerase specialized sigma24 family protein
VTLEHFSEQFTLLVRGRRCERFDGWRVPFAGERELVGCRGRVRLGVPRVASRRPRIAELDNPVPYLRVAVVNQCRSIHRRLVRAPKFDTPDPVLDGRLIELQDALRALNERQRTAVVLRYLCDLPDAEIADLIGCRVGTVRTLIHRGLAELRAVIK